MYWSRKNEHGTYYLKTIGLRPTEGEDIQVKKSSFEGSEGLDGSEGSVGPDGQLVQRWFERLK